MNNDNLEKLLELKKMLDLGIIDEAEFAEKKNALLHTGESTKKEQKSLKDDISSTTVLNGQTLDYDDTKESIEYNQEEKVDAPVNKNSVGSSNITYKETAPIAKKKTKGGLIALFAVLGVLIGVAVAGYFIPSLGLRCMVLGHDESGPYVTTKEPTCKSEGEAQQVCSICGKVINKRKLSTNSNHTYQNGKCIICGASDPNYYTPSQGYDYVQFSAYTLVELHVRTGPGLNYSVTRNLPYGSIVDVYETRYADGYTWNRINSHEWVANDGTYLQRR